MFIEVYLYKYSISSRWTLNGYRMAEPTGRIDSLKSPQKVNTYVNVILNRLQLFTIRTALVSHKSFRFITVYQPDLLSDLTKHRREQRTNTIKRPYMNTRRQNPLKIVNKSVRMKVNVSNLKETSDVPAAQLTLTIRALFPDRSTGFPAHTQLTAAGAWAGQGWRQRLPRQRERGSHWSRDEGAHTHTHAWPLLIFSNQLYYLL